MVFFLSPVLWLTTVFLRIWVKKKDYAKLSSYENNILTYCLWTVSNQFLFTGVCTKQLKSNLYRTSLIYSGINIINEQVLKSLAGLFCFKMICLFLELVHIFHFKGHFLLKKNPNLLHYIKIIYWFLICTDVFVFLQNCLPFFYFYFFRKHDINVHFQSASLRATWSTLGFNYKMLLSIG